MDYDRGNGGIHCRSLLSLMNAIAFTVNKTM